MTKRGTYGLLALLAILGLATFLVLRQPGEISSTGTSDEMLVAYDSAAVDRLEVVAAGGEHVTLTLEAGTWMISSPVRDTADARSVTEAVSKGRRIGLRGLVSSNPQKQGIFLVDSAGTLVRIYERGKERAAFRIGKTGPSFMETYVRREGSNDVYLGDGFLSPVFVRSVDSWRDTTGTAGASR